MIELKELEFYLNNLLNTEGFKDYCPNGIQIAGRTQVRKVMTAVTASLTALQTASEWNADLLLVHHGYFWKGDDPRIVGIHGRRIRHAIKHDLSVMAYHLPLDAHSSLGNNAQLAQHLNWQSDGKRFGNMNLGWIGTCSHKTVGDLVQALHLKLNHSPLLIGHPDLTIQKIGWCTGAAQNYFPEAINTGIQAFITGEISEQSVHIAHESGVAFIAAGHHATERYGIAALGNYLAQQFQLEHRFIDIYHPV